MFRWLTTLKNGQRYMRTWPMDTRLNPVFPENRVIKATRFAIRFMPPLVVVTLFWQIWLHGDWAPIIITALFALSFPFQGLYWLGFRSQKTLPDSLQTWYHQIEKKLLSVQRAIIPLTSPPTYQNLAELLNLALKQSDNDFLDKL